MQCGTMNRRTLTMDWNGLGEDDEDIDQFFEPPEKASSAGPLNLASSDSDEDDFEDSRMSFASTISSASMKMGKSSSVMAAYDMWMGEPGDIRERRKRLLQGMGLSSSKDMLRHASVKIARAVSSKLHQKSHDSSTESALEVVKVEPSPGKESRTGEASSSSSPSHSHPTVVLVRSRSDSDIEAFSDRQVVDWSDAHEMITAASYTPDGQGAVIGSHQGICRFYSIHDCKLQHTMDIQMKTKSQAKKIPGFQSQFQVKKITGFQFAPWEPSEVLITSTDSRIRIYNGPELIQKYRGFRNTSSQISASFTPDGKHIISASEDSQVYIWKVAESKNRGGGKRSRVTVQAHEHFHCKDVTVAIAWPGSIKNEPPMVEIHSKRHSKRLTAPPPTSDRYSQSLEDIVGASSRKHLPPLPKKSDGLERIDSGDEDYAHSSSIDPGIGVCDSFRSSSASISYHDSPSISVASSHFWSPSRSFVDNGGGHGGHQTVQATAWGMVILAASLEGEIRVYQNFGLPRKVGRQANLFRD